MKIIPRADIEAAINKDAVIAAVRAAFIAHSRGEIESVMPMHMSYFDEDGERAGDCHVKAAHSPGHPVIAIKVATGMYANAEKGLPVNSGLVLLLSRETGEPVALLQDEGMLTTWRTAAAGAIAASLVDTKADDVIGIVGTGEQAFYQAAWTTHHLGLERVMIYGRSADKAETLAARLTASGLTAARADSAADLCRSCRIIITTTPASAPVILAADLPAGAPDIHFVAVGADTYGKQELDSAIVANATTLVVDDKAQCVDHGEVAMPVADGRVDQDRLRSLGSVLGDNGRLSGGITVVDLTGLGAQDLAIASLVA